MSSSDATVLEARKRIEAIPDEQSQMAHMYMFLVAGEPSEVSGKYAPNGKDAHRIEYMVNGERFPAVLFVVKNSRVTPSKKNLHRGCILPLDKQYEPWTGMVFDWCQKHPDENPFAIRQRKKELIPDSYKRNLELQSRGIFKGMKWVKDVYRSNKEIVKRREIDFSSSSLSELRIMNLKEFYDFDEVDFAHFTGKRVIPSFVPEANTRIEEILSSNIQKDEIDRFKELSEEYFVKLLIPISFLNEKKSTSVLIREYIELNRRYDTAVGITNSIKNINYMFQIKLDILIFKEDMSLITNMLGKCGTEAEFAQHIGSLRSVFEIEMEPLRKILPEFPPEGKSIAWAEAWLKANMIKPHQSMIETWKMINSFRNNLGGFHSEPDPKILDNAYRYFGEKLVLPFNNYQRLWNSVLTQFKVSLDELQQIINNYEPKRETSTETQFS